MRLGVRLPGNAAACYASPEIAEEYRHPREDNLFVKNVSLPVSKFKVEYPPLTDGNKGIKINGQLLFSVNIDNNVATAIVVLNFERLSVDEVILLKHTFYKRCHVSILENGNPQSANTFQEYVASKLINIYPYLKGDIDSRARYMLLEVGEPIVNAQNGKQRNGIIYGMLSCDEGWRHAENPKHCLGKNYSPRDSYKLYYRAKNAIIVTSRKDYTQYLQDETRVWKRIVHAPSHIELPTFYEYRDIAGIDKQLYAKYLKTVEIDYLITNAMTSEISDKISKSLLNPIKLTNRIYKLWKILNELDLNLYHIDNDMLCSFDVTKNMNEIRQEYNEIVLALTNWLLIILAGLTLLTTIVTILK